MGAFSRVQCTFNSLTSPGCRGGDVLYQPAAAASPRPDPQPWNPHQVLRSGVGLRAKARGLRPRAGALCLRMCPDPQSPGFLPRPGLCQQPTCTQLRERAWRSGACLLQPPLLQGLLLICPGHDFPNNLQTGSHCPVMGGDIP